MGGKVIIWLRAVRCSACFCDIRSIRRPHSIARSAQAPSHPPLAHRQAADGLNLEARQLLACRDSAQVHLGHRGSWPQNYTLADQGCMLPTAHPYHTPTPSPVASS